MFRAFIGFLQTNRLTTRQILAEDEPVTESLRIVKSDLTDEGFEVVKAAFDKWLRGHDRGKEIEDVSVLEKALARLRQAP
jgi:hydroxymethylglutaryl-CoA reductase